MSTLAQQLKALGACEEAVVWATNYETFSAAWKACSVEILQFMVDAANEKFERDRSQKVGAEVEGEPCGCTEPPVVQLSEEQVRYIAMKHRTIVAGCEFADKFDFAGIAADISALFAARIQPGETGIDAEIGKTLDARRREALKEAAQLAEHAADVLAPSSSEDTIARCEAARGIAEAIRALAAQANGTGETKS